MFVSIILILQSSLSHQSTDDDDTKAEILVHFNLRVSDFSKIKTKSQLGLEKLVSQWQR